MGIRKEIKVALLHHDPRDGGNNTIDAIERILNRTVTPKAKPTLSATVADDTVRLHYTCGVVELAMIRRAIDDLGVELLNGEVDALIKATKEVIKTAGLKDGK